MAKRPLLLILFLYKRLISPLLGPCCRFYPSCADYSYQAIDIHGTLKGVFISGWRVLRCHPFSQGGLDPVPGQKAAGLQKIL